MRSKTFDSLAVILTWQASAFFSHKCLSQHILGKKEVAQLCTTFTTAEGVLCINKWQSEIYKSLQEFGLHILLYVLVIDFEWANTGVWILVHFLQPIDWPLRHLFLFLLRWVVVVKLDFSVSNDWLIFVISHYQW